MQNQADVTQKGTSRRKIIQGAILGMDDLQREIQEIIRRNQEIDLRSNLLKKTIGFQVWYERPVTLPRRTETRTFKLTLWKNTPKEETVKYKVTKGQPKRTNRTVNWPKD